MQMRVCQHKLSINYSYFIMVKYSTRTVFILAIHIISLDLLFIGITSDCVFDVGFCRMVVVYPSKHILILFH